MIRQPDRKREHSDSTEYVYETDLVTVYAVEMIKDDRYHGPLRVTVVVRGDNGLSEDQLGDLIAALDGVRS